MITREFDAVPTMKSLYGKALRGFIRRSADEPRLPQEEFVCSVEANDLDRLARYNSVCGFRLSDRMPATYPHVLAFPLQMSLLTDQNFPFPVLGLVHVSNRISQYRALRLGERFTIKVRAEALRSQGIGSQFDLVSQAIADSENSPVWTESSTYLYRDSKTASSRSGRRSSQEETGPAPHTIWRVPSDIGRRYAEVSGDRNPIHLGSLTARMFGFPSAIAHGMWMKARCLAALEGRISERFTIETRFKSPLLLPARAAFWAHRSGEGWKYELRDVAKIKVYLTGEVSDIV